LHSIRELLPQVKDRLAQQAKSAGLADSIVSADVSPSSARLRTVSEPPRRIPAGASPPSVRPDIPGEQWHSSQRPLPAGLDPGLLAAYRWLRDKLNDGLARAGRLQRSLRPESRLGNPDEVLFRAALDQVKSGATDELHGNLSASVVKYREALVLLEQLGASADRAHFVKDKDTIGSCMLLSLS